MRGSWVVALSLIACRSEGDGGEPAPGPTPAADEANPKTDPKADPKNDNKTDSKTDDEAEPGPPGPVPELLVPLAKAPAAPAAVGVSLPTAPTFPAAKVPETYPDGAYSIAGLRAHQDARVAEGEAGAEVMVRAYVAKIYVPPTCPEGEACPPPKQTHVWVVDDPDEHGLRRAMLVVNYRFLIPEWEARRWKDEPEVVLEQGQQYTFKGRFKRFSDTGFAHDQGLLEFVGYRPHDPDTGRELELWVYPPGSPWHPVEIARMEEQSARLAEMAAKGR
ncbi:MAG: hypothetical protein KDK70_35200 [Myxococcales bacterium]|nr:hypothetical protein [Myxococcales bacterium]